MQYKKSLKEKYSTKVEIFLKNKPDSIERVKKGDKFQSSAYEKLLVSGNIYESEPEQVLLVAAGEGKKPLSLISNTHWNELAHPHLFQTGKFGFIVIRKIPLSSSKYFDQRLLNFSQFSGDS